VTQQSIQSSARLAARAEAGADDKKQTGFADFDELRGVEDCVVPLDWSKLSLAISISRMFHFAASAVEIGHASMDAHTGRIIPKVAIRAALSRLRHIFH